jgi:hypothetical protein
MRCRPKAEEFPNSQLPTRMSSLLSWRYTSAGLKIFEVFCENVNTKCGPEGKLGSRFK